MTILQTPLHAICDAELCQARGIDLVEFATACLRGGARVLQLRAKRSPGRWLFETCTEILKRAEPFGAAVIVNDRADIVQLTGAHGVHVGQTDLSPAQVRRVLDDRAIVGRSTHTIEQVQAALSEPISYLAIGPVFDTATKVTGYRAVGLTAVRQAANAARPRGLPVVAIGGITLEQAPAVLRAGATSVAVIGDLLQNDPESRVRAYLGLTAAG